jgi:hypothetical protein
MKINTIDFDCNDKETVSRIIHKIIDYGSFNCKSLFSFDIKLSQHKGVSIILGCTKECDLCRFIFDDELRYRMDLLRLERHRNIIWREKELIPLSKRRIYK